MEGPNATTLAALLAADHGEIDGLFRGAAAALDGGLPVEAHTALDRLWIRLAVHIRAEHRVLFPALSEARPDLHPALGMLREEHDFFMAVLAGAVKGLAGAPPDREAARSALQAIRQRLAPHNAREEEGVYPAVEALPEERRTTIVEAVRRELATLPARYGQ